MRPVLGYRLGKGMTVPAVITVRNALQATIAAAVPTHQIIVDLPRADDIEAADVPCIVITIGNINFDFFEQRSTVKHVCEFEIEIYEKASSGDPSVAIQQHQTVALICAALLADYTLGGVLQDMMPKGVGASDNNAADIGAVQLSVDTVWFTAPGDFNTIV
jgi:hypothetical protein